VSAAAADGGRDRARRHALATASIVLLALLLREYFVLVAVVDVPIRGDIREYVLYAWNLAHRGVFGMSLPSAPVAVPDAYRFPGYPWFLVPWMALRPHGLDWLPLALQAQVLAGSATVLLTIRTARHWLSPGWSLLPGLLLALWPHHIAATGALLSEVVFGLALMAGLCSFAAAMARGQRGLLALAGACFGYAWLVNPLIGLFPPLLAILAWRRHGRAAALCLLGVFLVPVLGMGLRDARLPVPTGSPPPGRAAVNLVQGAWPQYHAAWRAAQLGDPAAAAVMADIGRETALLSSHPAQGMHVIAARMQGAPATFVAWYLWRKPLLLWDWEIQVGAGGIYVLDVHNSPLSTHPLLRTSTAVLHAANPWLTLLAFAGLLAVLVRDRHAPGAAFATALLMLYLTAVHAVFQAEPRYANAYRGIEWLMVATILSWVVGVARHAATGPLRQK